MNEITNYANANKILKELATSKGSHNSLSERLDFIENNGGSGGGSGVGVSSQSTKLGVTATAENPYVFEVDIPESVDLMRGPVEVLKFVPGETNKIQVVCNFDNSDSSSFQANDNVIFDGKMKLKTTETHTMNNGGTLGSGKVFSYQFDKTQFDLESIEVI